MKVFFPLLANFINDYAYNLYVCTGFLIIHRFAFLRGRGYNSDTFWICFRLFIASVVMIPIHKSYPSMNAIIIAYLPLYLNLAEFKGGKISKSFRNGNFANWVKRYFDCELIVHKPISVKQCVIGLHPHGILPFGTIVNIASETTQFSQKYPYLTNRIVIAASTLFLYPGFKEFLSYLGIMDCSRFNAERLLDKGHTVAVFPGGTREALYANPEEEWLDLKRKLGFVRLAMRNGIPLVPCYSFNESTHFKQLHYDYLDQFWMVRFLRIHTQLVFGLPLFPFVFNLLPPRCKIVTVLGEPINVPLNTNPSEKEVQEVSGKYIAGLEKLYNDYAHKYNSISGKKLKIT